MQSRSPRELDDRTDQVRGRLDAVLLASLVAPGDARTSGSCRSATTTHPEPFHIASAIVDARLRQQGPRPAGSPQVSAGRRGGHVGRARRRRPGRADDPAATALRDLFDEAADAVEVVRRLWDSWEDDAIIKDVATGRFIDRDKLHYIDFEGRFFSVKGPSIVPRPPQGQPLVAVLAHQPVPFEFAARSADVVFVTPADTDDVPRWVADVRDRRGSRRADRRRR